jgi:hypothetical protein
MEIESVASVAINLDVLGVWPKRLKGAGQLQWNSCLFSAYENLDLERATPTPDMETAGLRLEPFR